MCNVNKWFDCLYHKVITALRLITKIHEKTESETVCFPFHYTALKVLFVTICWVWAWVYSWASPAEIWHTEYAKTCRDNLVHSEGPASWGWRVSSSVQSLVFMKSVEHAGEVSLTSKTTDCSRDYDDGVFKSIVITGHFPFYVPIRQTFKMLRST